MDTQSLTPAQAKKLGKIVEGMPDEFRDYYLSKFALVKSAIDEYFPRTLTARQLAEIGGLEPLFDPDLATIADTILEPSHRYLERGGKMLRPVLVAMVIDAYGGDSNRFRPLLGAIEVMEDSSIMMDDYIDHSELRRGGPCGHVAHGYAIANLSSCTAFSASHRIFNDNLLGLDDAIALRLLDAVAFEHLHMGYGQIEELYWTAANKNTVTIPQYLQETIARCAFLSFRGPLRYAGIVAGAPDADIPILEKIGEYVLIGYHVKGDNLDMEPDSEAWGKIAGEDITTGRRTLLINHVLRAATPEDARVIEAILDSRTRDDAEKRKVYALVKKYGGLEFAQRLADEYNAKSQELVARLNVPPKYRTLLEQFCDFSSVKRRM
jgi:geranylgeranyl diphosphate synthase, type I